MKETGLPERLFFDKSFGTLCISDGSFQAIGEVYYFHDPGKGADIGPELVRRWNSYEQMREALKKALPYYKLSAVMGDTINQEIAQTIMDALALATPGKEGEK